MVINVMTISSTIKACWGRQKAATVQGQSPGLDRRTALLQDAHRGILLHIEGGRAYDRDMRRLVAEGLCKLTRRGFSMGRNASYLVLTEKGEHALFEFGIISPERDFELPAINPPKLIAGTDIRRMLDGKIEHRVQQIRETRSGDPLEPRPVSTDYVAFSFAEGADVYHWNPGDADKPRLALVNAGTLHHSGHGLKLVPVHALRIHVPHRFFDQNHTSTEEGGPTWWVDRLEQLSTMVPKLTVIFGQTHPTLDFTILCANDKELLAAKFLFPMGLLFKGG